MAKICLHSYHWPFPQQNGRQQTRGTVILMSSFSCCLSRCWTSPEVLFHQLSSIYSYICVYVIQIIRGTDNASVVCLHPEPSTLYIPNTEPKLPNFEHPFRAILSLLSNHGLIKYIDTKRQVFIRIYGLKIHSAMLVFSTQLCELLSL
jgi:hypothetical protein